MDWMMDWRIEGSAGGNTECSRTDARSVGGVREGDGGGGAIWGG